MNRYLLRCVATEIPSIVWQNSHQNPFLPYMKYPRPEQTTLTSDSQDVWDREGKRQSSGKGERVHLIHEGILCHTDWYIQIQPSTTKHVLYIYLYMCTYICMCICITQTCTHTVLCTCIYVTMYMCMKPCQPTENLQTVFNKKVNMGLGYYF